MYNTMNVHVCLTYMLLRQNTLERSIVAVIDVLRASTTICAALYHGAECIIPVASIQAAQERFGFLSLEEKVHTALGGESHGKKPTGFHFGNSPHEYKRERVEHKDIIFATTNGSRALVMSQHARAQIVAGFVNLPTVVRWIMENNSKQNDIILVCSGSDGEVSYEDTLCAGALVEALSADDRNNALTLSDAAQVASIVYNDARQGIPEAIIHSHHGQYLASIGFEHDLLLAAEIGKFPVVPVMNNGRLSANNSANNNFSFEVKE